MADTASSADVIHSRKSTRMVAGMNKKINAIMKQARKGEVKISKGMFFLPDDFKIFKGRGKRMLYIKKGLLVRLDKNK